MTSKTMISVIVEQYDKIFFIYSNETTSFLIDITVVSMNTNIKWNVSLQLKDKTKFLSDFMHFYVILSISSVINFILVALFSFFMKDNRRQLYFSRFITNKN